MEANLLLEQYSWYKKKALEQSPYRCLLYRRTAVSERLKSP